MKTIKEYINNEGINESQLSQDDAMNLLLGLPLPDSFSVNINLDGGNLNGDYNDLCVQRSIGQIIEAVIFTQLEYYYNELNQNKYEFKALKNNKEEQATGINKSCDFYLKDKNSGEYVNIEVKAYKKESNPTLTGTQGEVDYILGIKYDISKNVVSIKDVVLFSLKDKSKKRFSKEDTKDGFRLK